MKRFLEYLVFGAVAGIAAYTVAQTYKTLPAQEFGIAAGVGAGIMFLFWLIATVRAYGASRVR